MRLKTRLLLFLSAALAASAVACSNDVDDDGAAGSSEDALTGFTTAKAKETIAYGTSSSALSLAGKTDRTGVAFEGAAGDDVDIWVSGGSDNTAWLVAPNGTTVLATNKDAGAWTKDAHLRFALKTKGKHFIVAGDASLGSSMAIIHIEKKGAPAGALAPVASKDPCTSHPWPMDGQCREQHVLAPVPGPSKAVRAWSSAFRWNVNEGLSRAVASRDGSIHLLHGGFSLLRQEWLSLEYSVFDANGVKRSSTRVPVASGGASVGLALTADGTAWAMMASGELLHADAQGEMQVVATFPAHSSDGWGPLLEVDAKGRLIGRVTTSSPDVRVFDPATGVSRTETMLDPRQTTPIYGIKPTRVPLAGGDTLVQVSPNTPDVPSVTRFDAAGAKKWHLAVVTLVGVDAGRDRFFVSNDDKELETRSLATGALLWKAPSFPHYPGQLLVHANGDVVVTADVRLGANQYESTLYDLNGVKKGAVPAGGLPPEYALDSTGTTYVSGGGHLRGLDAKGNALFDVAEAESFGGHLLLGANRTLFLVGKDVLAFRP